METSVFELALPKSPLVRTSRRHHCSQSSPPLRRFDRLSIVIGRVTEFFEFPSACVVNELWFSCAFLFLMTIFSLSSLVLFPN
jgi:hypothetical protein